LEEARNQPWRLEVFRWKGEEGSARLTLADQDYLFRGITAKNDPLPVVELSDKLWQVHQDGDVWSVGP